MMPTPGLESAIATFVTVFVAAVAWRLGCKLMSKLGM